VFVSLCEFVSFTCYFASYDYSCCKVWQKNELWCWSRNSQSEVASAVMGLIMWLLVMVISVIWCSLQFCICIFQIWFPLGLLAMHGKSSLVFSGQKFPQKASQISSPLFQQINIYHLMLRLFTNPYLLGDHLLYSVSFLRFFWSLVPLQKLISWTS